jgi:AraC-like DNA-binding protein
MLTGTIPHDQIDCSFLEPGRGTNVRDGWVHTKTCPFTIVALATVGRYEVRLGRASAMCEPGQAFLVGANRRVSITHHADPRRKVMRMMWLHGHWSLFGTIEVTSLLDLPLKLSVEQTLPFRHIMEELLSPQQEGLAPPARRRELAFRALRLLCEIAPLKKGAGDLIRYPRRILAAVEFIREHMTEAITVEDLAHAAHLSVSRFHTLFRRHLERSPMNYVKELRLAEARRMLGATDAPVAEIADRTGFANQFHFSREFKKATGQTPTAYRKANSTLVV